MTKLLWIKEFLSLAVKTFRHPDRYQMLTGLLNYLRFLHGNRLPVGYLTDLWPDISSRSVQAHVSNSHHFELPYGEVTVLGALVAYLRPKMVFEFGTFTGATTKLIADISPTTCLVHTIDLPASEMQFEAWVADVIGREFVSNPEYTKKIVLHRSNTRHFNFGDFRGRVDLAFVDASHKYEDVLHDSRRALEMLSENGIIIWDDYQPSAPSVVNALNDLAQDIQLVHIANSRLVIHRRTPFLNLPTRHKTPWTNFPMRGKPEGGSASAEDVDHG